MYDPSPCWSYVISGAINGTIINRTIGGFKLMSEASKKYGDILFSKNAWSKSEIYSTFGIEDIQKTTTGTDEAALVLWSELSKQHHWVHLGEAFDKLCALADTASPTDSRTITLGKLTKFWNEQAAIMQDETPNELNMLESILSGVKNHFDSVGTVGRKQLKKEILRNSLNLFRSI